MLGNWKGEGEKGLGVKEVGEESGVRALESDIRYASECMALEKRGSELTFLEESLQRFGARGFPGHSVLTLLDTL